MRIDSKNANVFLLAGLGSLVLLNIIGLRAFTRVDVTRDKTYTLSKASKDTMRALQDPIQVNAYFTEKLPPPYSGNARYVRDLLEEFRAASKGQLSYQFIDPAADKESSKEMKRDIFGRMVREPTAVEKDLASTGIKPVEIRVIESDQVQTKLAYMGIAVNHQEKKEIIPLIQNTQTLEYDLTSSIRKMTRPKTPVIAVLQGHDEPRLEEKLTRLHAVLSQTYQVRPLDLSSKDKVDDDVDALLIIGPVKPVKENEIKAIDQFLMQGKSAAFLVDSVHVDLKTFQPMDTEHGLAPLLASYGIVLDDKLVADVQSAHITVQERRGYMVVSLPIPYPFVPQLTHLEGDSPITKGLAGVTIPFVTSVAATPAEGRQVAILAKSTAKSWLEPKPYNIDPRRDWRAETITTTGPYNLMVEVNGKLPSYFASQDQDSSGGLLTESKSEARVIAVGGSSLFWDDFMGRPNQALLLNVADWLLLDPALLAMRTRGLAEAPLQPDISDAVRGAVKYGNTFGIPLLLVLYGIVRWRMREARRAAITI
ncbi:MAG TPA: GldG family protein [Myxococcaceae bacterium]|nr:GldG family protein [Myxococcaceae bacterium]